MKKRSLPLVLYSWLSCLLSLVGGGRGAMFSDQMLAWGLVGRLLALLLAAGAAFVLLQPSSPSPSTSGGLLGIILVFILATMT